MCGLCGETADLVVPSGAQLCCLGLSGSRGPGGSRGSAQLLLRRELEDKLHAWTGSVVLRTYCRTVSISNGAADGKAET